MIRTIIYEDNRDLREAMSLVLQNSPGIQLVGSFAQCTEIAYHLDYYRPDVILMDIEMPGMDGLQGTLIAREKNPNVQVIILTVFEDEERLFTALRYGASGYFIKGEPPAKVVEGIKLVHNGGSIMSPTIARKVFDYFKPSYNQKEMEELSNREKEILKMIVDGDSFKDIAGKIFISIETVRTHIKHIYEKMHVRSKSQAVGKAIKERLV